MGEIMRALAILAVAVGKCGIYLRQMICNLAQIFFISICRMYYVECKITRMPQTCEFFVCKINSYN